MVYKKEFSYILMAATALKLKIETAFKNKFKKQINY
jgi:hypothetical protein